MAEIPYLIPCMRLLVCILLLLLTAGHPRHAAAGLIRDAEVERTLREIADPIFHAARLDAQAVNLFVVGSPTINAFVAGGMNIFVHTGLLLATDRPEMLAGVLAHETGHITGGHLAKGAEQLERATVGAVISYVLGGIAVASGAGDVGAAVMSGGGTMAERGMLAFTRSNENAADAAALQFLQEADISPEGLLGVFKILQRDEKRRYGKLDPYAITHPLSRERVNTLRDYLSQHAVQTKGYSDEMKLKYQRMLGKLEGFLEEPATIRQRYRDDAGSVRARYALAIADFRTGDVEKAVSAMRALIQEAPQDGYYYDTLGQIYFESGRIADAIEAYRTSVRLTPEEGLIQASYGQALLASTQHAAHLKDAITALERATQLDSTFGGGWRALAGAYGRAGRLGEQHLALAEEAMLANDLKTASSRSKQALAQLPSGSPAHMRAGDLNMLAVRELARIKEEKSSPFLHPQFLDPQFLRPAPLAVR